MATYYVDSAATGLNDGTSWTDAWTTPNSLPTLADGDIVYVEKASLDAHTYTANKTITGPTTGAAFIISATGGTTTYAKATADQFKITGASTYDITFNGGFSLHGIQVSNTKADIVLNPSALEYFLADDCTFKPAHSYQIQFSLGTGIYLVNSTLDFTNDTGSTGSACFTNGGYDTFMDHCTIANGSNRTGSVLTGSTGSGTMKFVGCDFSSLTNVTPCEIVHENSNQLRHYFHGCKFDSSWVWQSSSSPPRSNFEILATDCGTGSQPEYLHHSVQVGHLFDSTVNRTGGASVEGTNISWGPVVTETTCSKQNPYYSPWFYPEPLATTGSKTFTCHVQNNTADSTDTEQWLEVQVKKETTSGVWTTESSRGANPSASGTTNTDDTGSTWSSSQTYHQKLSVTATVNTVGTYRARVALAIASVASSENYYIDPFIVVT